MHVHSCALGRKNMAEDAEASLPSDHGMERKMRLIEENELDITEAQAA